MTELQSLQATFEHEGLCVSGTEAQQTAHTVVDELNWTEARKLEVDEVRVMDANAVCQDCVSPEDCNRIDDEWSDDVSVALPRRFKAAAVIGDRLLIHSAYERSLQEIDPTATPSVDTRVATHKDSAYDSSVKSRIETDLEKDVYNYIVHGKVDAEFLSGLRARIIDAASKGRTLNFDNAIKASQDREGYGRNWGQSERHHLANLALKGKVNGGIFDELPPVYYGKELEVETKRSNAQIQADDRDNYNNNGLCMLPEIQPLFFSRSKPEISKAQQTCLACPVFGECGILSLVDTNRSVLGVRAVLGGASRKAIKANIGAYNFINMIKKPDYPEIREELRQEFVTYQQSLRPEMLLTYDKIDVDNLDEKLRLDAELEAGLAAVFKRHARTTSTSPEEE